MALSTASVEMSSLFSEEAKRRLELNLVSTLTGNRNQREKIIFRIERASLGLQRRQRMILGKKGVKQDYIEDHL